MARHFGMVLAALVLTVSMAQAQSSRYTEWGNPSASSGDRLQEFIDKLNGLVDEAEKARAADPNFLRDLRDLANGFNRPWRVRKFDDDFLDGDATADPVWTTSAGKYWVERGWGLRSAVEITASADSGNAPQQRQSGEDKAAAIFGQILSQVLTQGQSGQSGGAAPARRNDRAIIHSIAGITNAFSLEADVSSWSQRGRIQIAVYQGQFQGEQSPGYRLAYEPGGMLELVRVSSRGTSIVDRAQTKVPLEDKKIHRVVWERHPNGRMTVSIDGTGVLEASDRGFRDDFNGLALINSGGDYIVKRISVLGTS